ncbi:helix-turn-helix domain-containing protein [Stackebrandtia nassauensis]|uniref:helix-turn-helix domain-containing protein n=1 Tax=Stackebrandtia nassauensis TaxID=283811 RepID=UPI003CC6F8D3
MGRAHSDHRPASLPELPADQHELLRHLAVGLSDQAIGRRMGMSRRTVQRRVRSLMDHFGVRTRFQLGMRAAKEVVTIS